LKLIQPKLNLIKKIKILIFLLTQNQTHIPTICPKKTLSLSLVDFYYNPKSKPKTSPISLSLSCLSLNYLYRRNLACKSKLSKLRMEEVGKLCLEADCHSFYHGLCTNSVILPINTLLIFLLQKTKHIHPAKQKIPKPCKKSHY
jgi:hypothetical protein